MADILEVELDDEPLRVEVLDKVQGCKLLDGQTRQFLGIGASEFLRLYDAGHYNTNPGDPEDTEVTRLEMLIPFAR